MTSNLRHRRRATRATAAVVSIVLTFASAAAQTPQSQSSLLPPRDAPMTLAEYQGLSCIGIGAVAGVGTLGYLDPIAVAATGLASPLLLVPVVAAGFAVGCSVGATIAPAFLWFYRRSQ
jgi:hypothetical protein